MQREHRGCVLVTDDGTDAQQADRASSPSATCCSGSSTSGRNPAALPIGDVMTPNPENLVRARATVAYVLNKMSVGGFRHVPVVDDEHRPVCVISVSDVVNFLVNAFPREVLNLPEPGTPIPVSREGA